jgi:hypothetical protein
MAAADVHVVSDEALGESRFMCMATLGYAKSGPAPLVDVVLFADLGV